MDIEKYAFLLLSSIDAHPGIDPGLRVRRAKH